MRPLISWIFLPMLLLGGNGIAIFLVSNQYSKFSLVLVVGICILISFTAERLLPYNQRFNMDQGDTNRDIAHAVVNEGMSLISWLCIPFFAGAITIAPVWPTEIPMVFQLLIAILIADIGISLTHYASHHVSWLWRLHAVHHSVTRMYGFNGLMKHPLHQTLEASAGVLPLLLVGVTQDVLALLLVAVAIQLLLQHSNVRYKAGALRYVLAINQVHRFHHLNSAKEGDVNFGLFTTFTDRLLGTAYFEPTCYFESENLGIENERDYPKGYVAQLLRPFK